MLMAIQGRKIGSGVSVYHDKFYRWRGDTAFKGNHGLDKLESYDFTKNTWNEYTTTSELDEMPRSITGMSLVAIRNMFYLFGGYAAGAIEYNRDLWQLNLETNQWQKLIPINHDKEGPMRKYLCGMIALDESTILIFGGFGLKCEGVELQKGAGYDFNEESIFMWTNELHLYSVLESKWINQETKGIKPPPCAAFSFTRIDQSRILLFGGRQRLNRMNEIHILNTSSWCWSGPIIPSGNELWPCLRSLHSAVCLLDPDFIPPPRDDHECDHSSLFEQRLLVIWGQNKLSDQIDDAWILKTNSLKWEQLHLPGSLDGRKWHSSGVYHPTPYEAITITTGGFKRGETSWNCPNHSDTVVVKFGIPTLYNLCISALCANYDMEVIDKVMSYLPRHVIADIQDVITKQADFTALFNPYIILDYSAKAKYV